MKKYAVIVLPIVFVLLAVFSFWISKNGRWEMFSQQYATSPLASLDIADRMKMFSQQFGFKDVVENLPLFSFDAEPVPTPATPVYRIGVMSDSHGYTQFVQQGLADMKAKQVDVVLHLGDFTAGGEQAEFQSTKDLLDASGFPYYVIPGDHDFNWVPEYSRRNYELVFGSSYDQVIESDHVRMVLFDNSVASIGDASKYEWLASALAKDSGQVQILFTAEPVFSEYLPHKADDVGDEIIDLMVDRGVEYSVAGNTHVYARYSDPDERVVIITVGAIGEYKNPLPQWVLVEVYADDSVLFRPQPLVDF